MTGPAPAAGWAPPAGVSSEARRFEGGAIDVHRHAPPARRVVVAVSPADGRGRPPAPGFGTAFALGRGHDVVALRGDGPTWTAEACRAAARALGPVLAGFADAEVVVYGSSNAGVAALWIGGATRAARVVAVSPLRARYACGSPVDPAADRGRDPAVAWPDIPGPADLPAPLRATVLFDPLLPVDASVVADLERSLGPRLSAIPIPGSGHPSAGFLSRTGQLSATMTALLADRPPPPVRADWAVARDVAPWLVAIGHRARASGRAALAERLYRRAMRVEPEAFDPPLQLSRLLRVAGRAAEAEAAADRAARREAPAPARATIALAQALARMDRGDLRGARAALDAVPAARREAAWDRTRAEIRQRAPWWARAWW